MSRTPSMIVRILLAASWLLCTQASADVLEANDEDLAFGVSVGGGYSNLASPEGEDHFALAQIGARGLLWGRFEAALDLRIDFRTAPAVDGPIASYTALLWIVGYLDLIPLMPFVGAGGGVSLRSTLDATIPTVGACAGLALWFAGTWRLSITAAQRWNFDERGSLATDVGLSGEWFF